MTLDARGYFQHLKSYLNTDYYAIHPNMHNVLKLKENIFTSDGEKEIEIEVPLLVEQGEAFAIKLDTRISLKKGGNSKKGNKNDHQPLFHFLDDQGKPWSKRCDFIIFHQHKKALKIYCFEFKYKSLPADSVVAQLTASELWCKALQSTIKIYTTHKKTMKLAKFALTYCDKVKVETYLDPDKKFLSKDPSIRHYHYDEISGLALNQLDGIELTIS
ncbi:hypothetical protein CF386_08665 [Paraphotobacterium marinum]|uniref:Uncharacterized protein n=1 Tax=Paraphotobacterium marinum TaxID=1755811 RepID=A0A220VFQ3_9GAMM|nr:hypothetical protein [Paraphotobacterium marinum]ASK79131.1 hypothetical protein CF386_08665 [Paraphotobacterium marinum]